MVKVGDKIRTESGLEGEVTHILKNRYDGRYIVLFQDAETPHYLIEGDESFDIIEES